MSPLILLRPSLDVQGSATDSVNSELSRSRLAKESIKKEPVPRLSSLDEPLAVLGTYSFARYVLCHFLTSSWHRLRWARFDLAEPRVEPPLTGLSRHRREIG